MQKKEDPIMVFLDSIILGGLVIGFFYILVSISDYFRKVEKERQYKIDDCYDRGVEYFKDIGSWPKLTQPPNEGKNAERVALERCRRTHTAF
jgi:hypothetical protein